MRDLRKERRKGKRKKRARVNAENLWYVLETRFCSMSSESNVSVVDFKEGFTVGIATSKGRYNDRKSFENKLNRD